MCYVISRPVVIRSWTSVHYTLLYISISMSLILAELVVDGAKKVRGFIGKRVSFAVKRDGALVY